MKRLLTVLLTGSAALSLASPAGAVGPDISRYGFEVVEQAGPGACGFAYTAVVRGKGQSFVFTDRDGDVTRAKATGPISVTFTNDRTGATARYSISGPSFYDADGELARGTGRWYAVTADGAPQIAIGNITFDGGVPVDPARTIDVCDALG